KFTPIQQASVYLGVIALGYVSVFLFGKLFSYMTKPSIDEIEELPDGFENPLEQINTEEIQQAQPVAPTQLKQEGGGYIGTDGYWKAPH
ncbi:hypothetical protein, partial [Pseudomonas aeruginosa]|uniref:hypothetical protein n=1 Tax=Pseudomonas aeruginosa TaxID=287 RepID=UPI00345801F8